MKVLWLYLKDSIVLSIFLFENIKYKIMILLEVVISLYANYYKYIYVYILYLRSYLYKGLKLMCVYMYKEVFYYFAKSDLYIIQSSIIT